ncbi:sugar ABC transporter ATP-binding protein [candidate division KSB1 bacterium]|nr:sugar ABC transporter ATP-binding protein [candidate division KSB1 bacterium]
MQEIDKSFPGVHALDSAWLDLYAGEAVALLGENGAGKSTLIKVLSGAHSPDTGRILLQGEEINITTPQIAQQLGIAVIYQEFNLIPSLTARENIFLGQEKTKNGFISKKDEQKNARELFDRLDLKIDPETRCRDLTVAQQQIVEIAKALATNAKIIIMDEPSATLTIQEVTKLFEIIRELKSQGIAIVYISHRLDEIFEIADQVTVMRDGKTIDSQPIEGLTRSRLIELMVGRKVENEFPKVAAQIGEEQLMVRGLVSGAVVKNISFTVRKGEVLGITGLVGAGKTEVARLIFGADKPDSGEIQLNGMPMKFRHPSDAIKQGICLLTEDRKAQGLLLGQSVRENFALPNLEHWSKFGFIDRSAERDSFSSYVSDLRIKIPHMEQLAKNLSGGNQQKVVLAKWLEAHSKVIIFDEPTRGIDVGAKYEIYLLMNKLAANGKSIIMISSELPEVLGMSDRILVMHEGAISGEITDVANTTQEDIMHFAIATRKV